MAYSKSMTYRSTQIFTTKIHDDDVKKFCSTTGNSSGIHPLEPNCHPYLYDIIIIIQQMVRSNFVMISIYYRVTRTRLTNRSPIAFVCVFGRFHTERRILPLLLVLS